MGLFTTPSIFDNPLTLRPISDKRINSIIRYYGTHLQSDLFLVNSKKIQLIFLTSATLLFYTVVSCST